MLFALGSFARRGTRAMVICSMLRSMHGLVGVSKVNFGGDEEATRSRAWAADQTTGENVAIARTDLSGPCLDGRVNILRQRGGR